MYRLSLLGKGHLKFVPTTAVWKTMVGGQAWWRAGSLTGEEEDNPGLGPEPQELPPPIRTNIFLIPG